MSDPGAPLILFRNVCPTDLNQIFTLEKNSYPADEKASRAQLQYRQHHAVSFFRCAVLLDTEPSGDATGLLRSTSDGGSPLTTITTNAEDNRNSLNGIGQIIGFVTGTRCRTFDEEAMKVHEPSGKLLAIHSVVVSEEFRGKGLGTRMLQNYLDTLNKLKLKKPIEKAVLITKMRNIGLYLRSGFSVLGKSKICHGQESWYDCELKVKNEHDAKKKEKSYECWIMDSFAIKATNTVAGMMIGIGGSAIATSSKGTGNPAGVVLITDGGQMSGVHVNGHTVNGNGNGNGTNAEFDPNFEDNQHWMKIVAREFNLSETAFIWKKKTEAEEANEYFIRYYTCDGSEVDLCGHATLAASSAVFQKMIAEGEGKRDQLSVVFHAKFDVLKARPGASERNVGGNTSGSFPSKIVMEFPSKGTVSLKEGSSDKTDALAMIKQSLFSNYQEDDFQAAICQVALDSGGDDLLVEITADAFFSIPSSRGRDSTSTSTSTSNINFSPMRNYGGYKRGIILCCAVPEGMKESGERADFYSRFFGPKVGIEEDPVTGSAHCVLGPYFGAKLGKDVVVGSQRSQRGGIVECTMVDDKVVRIGGNVTKAMSGKLFL